MDFKFTNVDPLLFSLKLFDRLTLCRDIGCFNGCWGGADDSGQRLKFVGFDQRTFRITLENDESTHPAAIAISQDSRHNNDRRYELSGDPLSDSVLFEELYLFIHHTNLGICQVKTSDSLAPLDRIETLEEHVNALLEASKLDELQKRQRMMAE